MNLDLSMLTEVLTYTRSMQRRYDHTQKPEKLAAKKRAAELVLSAKPSGGKLLDIGGEEFYQHNFGGFEISTYNLPNDMHEIAYVGEFDAVVAMHVLEHSPFPLFVLRLIHRALKPGGVAYVAVPRPSNNFCTTKYGHWSVMRAQMWKTLLVGAGFRVDHYEPGKFGPRKRWVEQRFLCSKPGEDV